MMVSDLFGNLSQFFWLFAQVPQMWKNYRLKSVDGLALPFLFNWFCGDITNLIGCILTNQLPFQRNLAIYFNFVDLVLLFQYASYVKFSSVTDYQVLSHERLSSEDSETPEERWRCHRGRVSSIDLEGASSLARQYSRSISRPGRKHTTTASGGALHEPLIYSSLSEQTDLAGTSPTRRESPRTNGDRGRSLVCSASLSDEPDSYVTDSNFDSGPSRSLSQTAVPASPNGPTVNCATSFRPMSPIVFLGVFAFLVFNTTNLFRMNRIPFLALSTRAWAGSDSNSDFSDTLHLHASSLVSHSLGRFLDTDSGGADLKETVGRLAAWVCAVLYLTSRLPQIWKNYCRKSVEGLSMLLFIMAFLGNLTYVISILTSPLMHTEIGYLQQSIPYLIGSGGTLCFDLTIYIQSQLYGPHALLRSQLSSRTLSDNYRLSQDNLNHQESGVSLSPDPPGTFDQTTPPSSISPAHSSN